MSHSEHRPSSGTRTGRVWEIADELTRSNGRTATRGEVVKQFTSEGGNPNTASTQFHKWKQTQRSAPADRNPRPMKFAVQVKDAGRILLPADIREALGIAEGDTLQAVVQDGELRLMTPLSALRRLQEMVASKPASERGTVDDFLAWRRAEAARDEVE